MATVTAIPSSTPREPYGLSYWMDRVLTQLHHVRTSTDADAVHDARVAIRRCRSLAAVLREVDPHPDWAELKRLPRKLFRALGKLRDTQVLEDWVCRLALEDDPLRAKLLGVLEVREARSRARAHRAAARFDEKTWKRLAHTLRHRVRVVPPDSLAAQCLALERCREAHHVHTRALRTDRPKPWHALRIGVKRFRYTVENLLPERYAVWEENLKRVQDLLGEVHDLDVLSGLVREVLPEDSVGAGEVLRAAIQRARQHSVDKYRQRTLGHTSLWREWLSALPHGETLANAAAARIRATARAMDSHPRRNAEISRIALRLFDGLADAGCAPAFRDRNVRRVLRAAARLHGIGAALEKKPPHKAARSFLLDLPLPPGWTASDWEILAWTIRYHRGAEPSSKQKGFSALPEHQRKLVRGLAGVLRLARALRRAGADSRQNLSVKPAPDAIHLFVPGLIDKEENSARLAAGKHLLEAYLRRSLLVDPVKKVIPLAIKGAMEPVKALAASD